MSKITIKLLIMVALAVIVGIRFHGDVSGRPLVARAGATISGQPLRDPARPGLPGGAATVNISLVQVATGFTQPVQVTHAGDGSGRLFVIEQAGRILILKDGVINPTPFLNIVSIVGSVASEQGLLGAAFHPNYINNGQLFVNYTNKQGDTVIARYQVKAGDPNEADPASEKILMTIGQPNTNHNGGQLLFGPDGYLYIGMGDGGGSNDPGNHGQNKETLLGAMLRIDVDSPPSGKNYGIPAGNPYVGQAGADEIWLIGLRNPWRFSFDRATGDLYIGDVGQGDWEEIDFQAAGTPGGLNLGWNICEGFFIRGTSNDCRTAHPDFTDPILAYDHTQNDRSVTGGFVYRGHVYGRLVGRYFYGDFISGRIWSIKQIGPNSWSGPEEGLHAPFNISAFGEDEAGELYVVDYRGGRILHLVDAAGPSTNFIYYFPLIFKGTH